MAYLTHANIYKIVFGSDLQDINIDRELYKIRIYFYNKYEENALLAFQELLEDPENFIGTIYKPYISKDTFSLVYEGGKPSYHKFSCCPRLNAEYSNFEIPQEIQDKGKEAVKEFRDWFKTVSQHIEDDPEIFVMRLQAKYGINTNPKAIKRDNSGYTKFDNISLDELEPKIDAMIKEAGRFYYQSDKNTEILKRFSKLAYLGEKTDLDLPEHNLDYSNEEIRELLKSYETRFKKPLAIMLRQYYRLKLNPDIKIEGTLLDGLGFKPCGNCHHSNYIPQKDKDSKPDDLPF